MKRLLSFILALILISSVFCFTAFAEDNSEITISEDYTKIYYDGKMYLKVEDSSAISSWNTYTIINVSLSKKQENEIEDVYIEVDSEEKSFIYLSVLYKKGGSLSEYYIEESRLEEYDDILNGNGEVTYVCFSYAAPLYINDSDLLTQGESISLMEYEVASYEQYEVYKGNSKETFSAVAGYILVDYDVMDFYYKENSTGNVYEITDAKLIEKFKAAYEEYKGDFSMFGGNDGKIFFLIVSALILGVIPVGILVFGIILLVKAKKPYKKYMITIVALTATELISFIILFVNLLLA